jgi:glutathione S-transferase
VRLDPAKGDTRSADSLAVHPLGQVPALEDEGVTIVESVAIVQHLADKCAQKGLTPPPGTAERAKYYQWMACSMLSIEPHCVALSREHRRPEVERDTAVIALEIGQIERVAAPLERELARQDYVLGAQFSAADVVVASVIARARMLGAT